MLTVVFDHHIFILSYILRSVNISVQYTTIINLDQVGILLGLQSVVIDKLQQLDNHFNETSQALLVKSPFIPIIVRPHQSVVMSQYVW
ncbi:MAG: hypothetical protein ACOZBL_05765 [Patescibacteria group bacterium]